MEKITVYVNKETKGFLKGRRVSMSHWIRETVNRERKRYRGNRERMNKKYRKDEEFRERNKLRCRIYRNPNRYKIGDYV